MFVHKKEVRNKFNGKLVMKWSGLSPGPMVAEAIENFYVYIEKTYSVTYVEYIGSRTPREVRADFLVYFDPIGDLFD